MLFAISFDTAYVFFFDNFLFATAVDPRLLSLIVTYGLGTTAVDPRLSLIVAYREGTNFDLTFVMAPSNMRITAFKFILCGCIALFCVEC